MSRSLTFGISAGAMLLSCGIAGAAESYADRTFFNRYMLLAVERMKTYAPVQYDLKANFTKSLRYGTAKIEPKINGATMCNGAVTQAILEAIEIYSEEQEKKGSSWSPEHYIPAESWTKSNWTMLKPHLFSESYFEYPPLEMVPRSLLWSGLGTSVKNFHSERGMGIALEKFGLGETVERFEDARPGDVISFDRAMETCKPAVPGRSQRECRGVGGAGHAVVFLRFLTRDQRESTTYRPNVVGFKYFSVQSSAPSGLGERWAYFRGFCPYSTEKRMPADATRFCPDSADSEPTRDAHDRKRFPLLAQDHVRDCCIVKPGQKDGPRVGRMLMPRYWTRYKSKQRQIEAELKKIKQDQERNIEHLLRGNEILRLYATGAVALEKKSDKARMYIEQVRDQFGIDLRAIGQGAEPPEVSYGEWFRIAHITPPEVIRKANQQVTKDVKAGIERRIAAETTNRMRLLEAQRDGVPNAKLDGRSC